MLKFIKGKTTELPFEPDSFYKNGDKLYLTINREIVSPGDKSLENPVHEQIGDGLWKTSYVPVCTLDDNVYAIDEDRIVQINGQVVKEFEVAKPEIFLASDRPMIFGIDTDGKYLYATFMDDYEKMLGTLVLKDMEQAGFIPPGEMLSQGSDGRRFFQIRKSKIETFRNGRLGKRYPANLEKLTSDDIGLVGIISGGKELFRLTRGDIDSPVTMRPLESKVELHNFSHYPSWGYLNGNLVTLSDDGLQVFKDGILHDTINPKYKKDITMMGMDGKSVYVLAKDKIHEWQVDDVDGGYKRKYGSSRGMIEALMHTGDSWDYPKWYISYLLGNGTKSLPASARKLLACLDDGKWKHEINEKVGVGTIEACTELQLIDMRPYEKTARGFIGAYRITERGKIALEKSSLP